MRIKSLNPKLTQTEGFILGVGAKMFTIACHMPNLFRFVFVVNKDECKNSDVVQKLQLDNTKKIIHLLCEEKGLTESQAVSFLMNYEFYIHGIASYTASGFVNYPEEEIIAMANRAKDAFLESEMRTHHETE